jgi:hypothetical protein
VEVAVAKRPYLCRTVRLQWHELPFLEIAAAWLHPLEAVKTALVGRDLRVVVEWRSVWVEEEAAGLHPLQVVKKAWVVRDLPVVVEGCSAWVEVVVAAEVEAGLFLLVLFLQVISQQVVSPPFELSEAEVEVAAAVNPNPNS